MSDVPLFEDPEEPDDLSEPTGRNIAAWLAAEMDRRVAVLAPDHAQAQTWAEARNVPRQRMTVITSAGNLHGIRGEEHVIVRIKGPGGQPVRLDRRMATAIGVAKSALVWFIDDVIPMEAEAAVSQTIGGAELFTLGAAGTQVRVVPRHPRQGDSFTITIDGDTYEVPRDSIEELVEVIAAWRESRPYVDAAAARAAEIRAAFLATGDPFAAPPKS